MEEAYEYYIINNIIYKDRTYYKVSFLIFRQLMENFDFKTELQKLYVIFSEYP